MDRILNFALQGGNSNEDRQSMPSPGQQWMQTNPQLCMPQGMVPMFAPTSQPFVQQPYFGPTCQPFVEQPTEGHADVPQSSAKKQIKVKLGNFSAEEDVNIIKWWLGIGTDPIINTGQRAAGFWTRITNGYNSTRGSNPMRTMRSINHRWDDINKKCAKFADYYAKVLRENPSGMSDADKTTEALARFARTEPKPFSLMHCWHLLKDEPKWQALLGGQSKTTDTEDDDCYVTAASDKADTEFGGSTPSSGGTKRPLGRDAAKQNKKKSTSSSGSAEYVSKMCDLWSERFREMNDHQVEKTKQMAHMAQVEKEKNDRQLEIEERRLALDARRLEKEERAEVAQTVAEEERILNIDLDTCKPSMRFFLQSPAG